MDDLITRHLRHARAAGLSSDTLETRTWVLGKLDSTLPFGLAEATTEELEDWLAAGDWAAETRSTYYGHLVAFFRWACSPARPRLDYDPTAGLVRPRVTKGTPHPCTDEQLRHALDHTEDPWRRYIVLAAYAGLRSMEIAGLHRRDITPDLVTVRHGKGGRGRTVPTVPAVWHAVRTLPDGPIADPRRDGRPADAYYITRRMSSLFDRLGMPEVTLHWMRHWYGTTMLRACKNLRVVQECLGHVSPATTAVYTLITDEQRRDAAHALPDYTVPSS